MRILFDARVLGEQMHGIARYCLNMLQQLLGEDRGHEYVVLIGRSYVQEWFTPTVPVKWIQTSIPLYSVQEQFLIPSRVRREAFDLFHSPTYTIPLFFADKGILTIHDLIHLLFPKDYGIGHRFFYRLIVRRAVSRSVQVFTVSEQSKKDIISLLKGDERKIVITPNGLEPTWGPLPMEAGFRERYGLHKGFLLYVGNPRPHKNFSRVLSAFDKLILEDGYEGKLVAVGIDPRDQPESLLKRVVFLPFSNDRELRLLYSGADLLAAPSLYEGFGLPVLEAMACGCPVLVGNQGSLPEIAGDAGLAVDPYQVPAILEGIKKVLRDQDLSRKMREEGLKRAAGYTWGKTARIVLMAYASLVKELRTSNFET